MSAALTQDIQLLRRGLAGQQDEIEVTLHLPRESAKKVLALLDAEQRAGAVVVPVKEEFTTTEAARLLDISRPTLMKLINSGRVEFRKVGRHHRLPASAVQALHERLQAESAAEVPGFAEWANRVGQLD